MISDTVPFEEFLLLSKRSNLMRKAQQPEHQQRSDDSIYVCVVELFF